MNIPLNVTADDKPAAIQVAVQHAKRLGYDATGILAAQFLGDREWRIVIVATDTPATIPS